MWYDGYLISLRQWQQLNGIYDEDALDFDSGQCCYGDEPFDPTDLTGDLNSTPSVQVRAEPQIGTTEPVQERVQVHAEPQIGTTQLVQEQVRAEPQIGTTQLVQEQVQAEPQIGTTQHVQVGTDSSR